MNGSVDYSVLENEQLAKLEPGPRANVQFKPSKKMKKRRQLDALVSNGKKLSRRKQSGHELLRSNDSESSEVEEFSVLERQKWERRWPSAECCSTCLTLAVVLVVASCILACATVIWMHVQLKEDFNHLRERMELVENKNAGTPEKFQALQSTLTSVNKTVSDMRRGKYGLDDLNKTIVSMQKQITSLTATATQLQQTVQSSQPANSKDTLAMANTVADIGSGLQTTQATVESLKTSEQTFTSQIEDLKNRVSALENPDGREGGSSGISASDLQVVLAQLNSTLTQHIDQVAANLDKQQTHMDTVDKFTESLQEQLTNMSQQVSSLRDSQQRLRDLQSQQVNKGNTTGSEAEKVPAEPVFTLTQLKEQVNNLQQQFEQLQTDHKNLTTPAAAVDTSDLAVSTADIQAIQQDHVDLVLFKTEVYRDINSLNASIATVNGSVTVLNQDVMELFSKVTATMTDLSNVTSVVEGLTNVLQVLQATGEGKEGTQDGQGSGDGAAAAGAHTDQKTTGTEKGASEDATDTEKGASEDATDTEKGASEDATDTEGASEDGTAGDKGQESDNATATASPGASTTPGQGA